MEKSNGDEDLDIFGQTKIPQKVKAKKRKHMMKYQTMKKSILQEDKTFKKYGKTQTLKRVQIHEHFTKNSGLDDEIKKKFAKFRNSQNINEYSGPFKVKKTTVQ